MGFIAKSNTGKGFYGTISYAEQTKKEKNGEIDVDEKPQLVESNYIFSSSIKGMASEMREQSNLNENVQKPVLHMQISFSPDEKLTSAQQLAAVKNTMEGIGIDDSKHQYLIYKHNNTEQEHYHLIVNRVDLDGKVLDNKNLNRKLIVEADRVEKEMGLSKTEGRTIFYDPSNEKGYRNATREERIEIEKSAALTRKAEDISDKNEKIKAVKIEVKSEVSEQLKHSRTPDELKENLKESGINVKFREDKRGIYGVSFEKDNISVKGISIGCEWAAINKVMQQNQNQNQTETIDNLAQIKALAAQKAEQLENQKNQSESKGNNRGHGMKM